MNLFDIDPWLLHVVCNCKQKENCLLPIDNHLRYSQEIDQEFNQSVVYNSIESYKRSYFLFFSSQDQMLFFSSMSARKKRANGSITRDGRILFFVYPLMILKRNQT